ncbi:MAG: hypothetical protein CVV02_09220 [Firmicutes bacterium HGW-Firmicutes-7]|nr:MAG: hypothetical protein CVV02_09220 [Firmicutes bacterium HGW-Firmicutes-7]
MTEIEISLIKVLKSTLNANSTQPLTLSESELLDFYHLAQDHQIHTLIYASIKSAYLKDVQANAHFTHIQQINRIQYVFQILKELNCAGIKVIALKGLYLMNLYPKKELRLMGDIDILVRNEDFYQSAQIFEVFGYRKKIGGSTKWDITLVHDKYISIELHHSLFDNTNLNNLQDFEFHLRQNSILYEQYGIPIYRPTDEDHIIYLFMHMAKHLTTGGFGLRQVADVYLLLKNGEYAYKHLLERLSHYQLQRFAISLMHIIQQWFDLDIPINNISLDPNINHYINILKKDIISSGVYGKGSSENIIRHIQLPYYQQANSKLKIFLTMLFPSSKKMRYRYNYVNKHWFLLPAAWFHRIFINLFIRKDLNINEKIHCISSFDKQISDRMLLLKWLQL